MICHLAAAYPRFCVYIVLRFTFSSISCKIYPISLDLDAALDDRLRRQPLYNYAPPCGHIRFQEKMLVLYGSQTGNSLDVAERIERECRRRGGIARVCAMDAYDVSRQDIGDLKV